MSGDRSLLSTQSIYRPRAGRLRVGHRLKRGKRLRRDNKERFLRIEVVDCFEEVRTINVGYEAEYHRAFAVGLQGFVGHHRPKIGPTDADVHDVANALAGITFPLATAHTVGEVG